MKSIISHVGRAIMEGRDPAEIPKAHSSCCALWYLPSDLANEVLDFGKEKVETADLNSVEDGEDGLETNIHVTILWGIEDCADVDKIREIAATYEPIIVDFDKLSLFENEQDVLKISVISEGLGKLHEEIKKKVTNKWARDSYKPHVTIAYLKSGTGKKYTGLPETEQPLYGKTALITEFVLVDTEDTKYHIDLAPSRNESVYNALID